MYLPYEFAGVLCIFLYVFAYMWFKFTYKLMCPFLYILFLSKGMHSVITAGAHARCPRSLPCPAAHYIAQIPGSGTQRSQRPLSDCRRRCPAPLTPRALRTCLLLMSPRAPFRWNVETAEIPTRGRVSQLRVGFRMIIKDQLSRRSRL